MGTPEVVPSEHDANKGSFDFVWRFASRIARLPSG